MELNQLTDDELVKLYSLGENKAFEVLLQRYDKRVFQYISFQTNDLELTKDIFQDTFFKAIVNIRQEKYTGSGRFGAWLCRIAHNLIVDYYCKENKAGISYADELVQNNTNNSFFSEKSIEDVISNEQVLCDVNQLLNKLPLIQQSVVHMRFFQDLSFNEIAEKTNVSVNTALGRMRYALINIRRMVNDNDLNMQLK